MIVKYFSLIATCLSLVQANEVTETNSVSQVTQSEVTFEVNALFVGGRTYTGCYKPGDKELVLRDVGDPSRCIVLNCELGDE